MIRYNKGLKIYLQRFWIDLQRLYKFALLIGEKKDIFMYPKVHDMVRKKKQQG